MTSLTATDRNRAVGRALIGAAALAAALPFSLMSLARDYEHGAVLGELALVPPCALALALLAAHRHPWVLHLRAGRADYAIAALAFVAAVALLALGPVAAGNYYAALRVDLLALPLAGVAAVCLLFGVRAMVAFAVPLMVAVLAWPLPMRAILEPAAAAVTAATAAVVRAVLGVLPVASVVPGPGDLRLTVEHADGAFDVVVASACSGVSGVLGMLLVGLCAQYVLHGRTRARVAWLGTAVLLAWLLNLVRIVLLLATGRTLGQAVAMDVLHPVAGLVLLNAAMVGLVLLAGRFGLRFSLQRPVPSDTPLTAPAPEDERCARGPRLRRVGALVSGVLALAAVGSAVPVTVGAYRGGEAAAASFTAMPDAGRDFEMSAPEEITWARPYFGGDSSWTRHRAAPVAGYGHSLWIDAVLTPDWSALRAHPVLDCYSFHGYELLSVSRPTLASGLLADQVVYRRQDGATWHVLSWEWPVRRGEGLVHERVTLLASSDRTEAPAGRTTVSGGVSGALARWLARKGTGKDPNPGLAAALRHDAAAIIDAHVGGGAATERGAA